MKEILHNFLEETNLKGNLKGFIILLIATSFLYCSTHMIISAIVLNTQAVFSYLVGYLFLYLGGSIVYSLILFQFISKYRNVEERKYHKSIFLPIIGIHIIYYIIFLIGNYFSYYSMLYGDGFSLVVSIFFILFICLYFPLQIFSMISIYDGIYHPLKILKNSIIKLISNYQWVFYATIAMGIIWWGSYHLMSICLNQSMIYTIPSIAETLFLHLNPFTFFFRSMSTIALDFNHLFGSIISLLYGIVLCICLSIYYMMMIKINDRMIKHDKQ